MCAEKTVYYGFKITKPLTSLRFRYWPLIIVNSGFSPLCAWFPPCYYEKCTPRGEGAAEWFFSGFHPIFPANQGCKQKLLWQAVCIWKVYFSKVHFFKCIFDKHALQKSICVSVFFIQIFSPIRVGAKSGIGRSAPQHITIRRGVIRGAAGCEPEKSPNFLLIIDRYHPPHLSDHCHSATLFEIFQKCFWNIFEIFLNIFCYFLWLPPSPSLQSF